MRERVFCRFDFGCANAYLHIIETGDTDMNNHHNQNRSRRAMVREIGPYWIATDRAGAELGRWRKDEDASYGYTDIGELTAKISAELGGISVTFAD